MKSRMKVVKITCIQKLIYEHRASCNFQKPVAILGHYLLTIGGPGNIFGSPEIKYDLSSC